MTSAAETERTYNGSFIFYPLLLLMGVVLYVWATVGVEWSGYTTQEILRFCGCTAAGAAVLMLLLTLFRRLHMKAQHVFLLLFIPISLVMMFILPINQAPDEWAHLQRAYTLSEGRIPGEDNKVLVPDSLLYVPQGMTINELIENWDEDIDPEMTEMVMTSAIGIYPPISHLPQAAAMAAARLFTRNFYAVLYAGRLGAWLTVVLLLYFAIRITPAGKYALIGMSLFPMFLNLAASASADAMTVAMICLYIACTARLSGEKRPVNGSRLAALTVLSVLAASAKIMYAPVILLILAVPKECFTGRIRKWHAALCCLVLPCLILGGWGLVCLKRYGSQPNAMQIGTAGQITERIMTVLKDPWGFLVTVTRSVQNNFDDYLKNIVGNQLSWLSVPVPAVLVYGMMFAWLRLAVHEKDLCRDLEKLRAFSRLAAMASFLSLAVIFGFLYVWWTLPNDVVIQGIQGRYFLPLLFPMLMSVLKFGGGEAEEYLDGTNLRTLQLMVCISACSVCSILQTTMM